MTHTIKRRGRPKGTGKDDGQLLAKVADMIIANSELKPTTAMKRLAPKATDAEIRRWQVKWQESRNALLASARGRADQVEAFPVGGNRGASALTASGWAATAVDRMIEEERRIDRLINPPELKFLRQLENDPVTRMMAHIENDPVTKMMRQIENDPVSKMMREERRLMDSLGLRRPFGW